MNLKSKSKSLSASSSGLILSKLATCISVQGARHHNLKNVNLSIPLHQLTVVTGLSGSGKSTLAFDTLYAEGQRRYVETFSPYTRQFLERMDKPEVDRIEGLPPAIAIQQTNSVKTSRSTVGTMTEIADHLKVLMPKISTLFCPKCDREIHPYSVIEIIEAIQKKGVGPWLVGFSVSVPETMNVDLVLDELRSQGFHRLFHQEKVLRLDEATPESLKMDRSLWVILDRVSVTERVRFKESVERGLEFGKGVVLFREAAHPSEEREIRYSNRWYCPDDRIDFKEPTPALFSFNNPVGACPSCKGFGRVVEIDYDKAIPDHRLTLASGVIKPFQTPSFEDCQKDLIRFAKSKKIPLDIAFDQLKAEHRQWVIEGDPEFEEGEWTKRWYGVKGFFRWLESKSYKMHVRVLLSKYRTYLPCESCRSGRFQPETLNFQVKQLFENSSRWTLPQLNQLPMDRAIQFFDSLAISKQDPGAEQIRKEILARCRYLTEVGLGYLTLDRSTRGLSGGEVQRVNLTSCLGNSLVNTLFVLDEPSVGLHPRDIHQLVGVLHRLRDRGNTVVVVEHEESVMRSADHLVDMGPLRGEQGGEVVFSGTYRDLLKNRDSLTSQYLRGEKTISVPKKRRNLEQSPRLIVEKASEHNLKGIDVSIPLKGLIVVTGVSGSGKSSLIHHVLAPRLEMALKFGHAEGIQGTDAVQSFVTVDQSPLTKSSRSNPALYLGIYDDIRTLFAETEEAKREGFTASHFSFNSSLGRCERCAGTGFEKIEMQFLADVHVICPICNGKRFQNLVLQIPYQGKTVDQVLAMTVHEALLFFGNGYEQMESTQQRRSGRILSGLKLLSEVGLEYLRLGQPLSQLSGGEAQRIKLLSYLHGLKLESEQGAIRRENSGAGTSRVILLDEPTTGLHFEDIRLLLLLFHRMVDQGDSVIIIEHNLDVIKNADWVIDLGPEGGEQGGTIIAAGRPEEIAKNSKSHTGRFLKEKLQSGVEAKKEKENYSKKPPSPPKQIEIRGARHHNLKNIDLDIQLNEITVFTGLSGSGKSTLAFDLLFSEGQRRYLDSLNAFARQFVEQMEKPDVDRVTGIPPAVAIEQRLTQGGGKSTVSTVTEIHQFLRLLYSKLATPYDPQTGEEAQRQSLDEISEKIDTMLKKGELTLVAPLIKGRKGIHTELAAWALKNKYPYLRVDGKWIEPQKFKALDRFKEHSIDLILGNLSKKLEPAKRRDLIQKAVTLGKGVCSVIDSKSVERLFSTHYACSKSGRSFEELDPRLFSFNSPHGWCPTCQGFGRVAEMKTQGETALEIEVEIEQRMESKAEGEESILCPDCQGSRLNEIARAVRLPYGAKVKNQGRSLPELGELSIEEAFTFIQTIKLVGREAAIAQDILPEIEQRLGFLIEVGLGYLTLNRGSKTLSGGESQRIRLAAQLGTNLQGVLYVLDEPTIGLHPQDNDRLLKSLQLLRDKGNTLVIVEHDEETMKIADRIIDLGPGAGIHGGKIIADGTWKRLIAQKGSITGHLLGNPLKHPFQGKRREPQGSYRITQATTHNLKNLNIDLPLRVLNVICGVSGSGKSTLIHEVLKPRISAAIAKKAKIPFDAVIEVDQSPIGKTSRSTPATYLGIMDRLRALYAQIPLARQRGYSASRFSFNTKGGRCEVCQGQGDIKIEMSFMPSFHAPCESCLGKRFNQETLEIHYREKSIADLLSLSVDEAVVLFESQSDIRIPLELMRDIGLGYLTLGQKSSTLSGGESQRIKMVAALTESLQQQDKIRMRSRQGVPHHLYLLEEPTIGLHMSDVEKLLRVFHRLVDLGHTVVVIEHHLDVIAEADWLLELGPVGGERGGYLIAEGTPETIVKKKTATSRFLKEILDRSP